MRSWGALAGLAGVLVGVLLVGAREAAMPVAAGCTLAVGAAGLWRRGLARRRPWPWLLAALACFVVGWTLLLSVWGWSPEHTGRIVGVSAFLVGYLLVAAAMVDLVRTRTRIDRLDIGLDVLLVTAAAAAIIAEVLLVPTAGVAPTVVDHVVFLAIPLLMTVVFAAAVWLLVTGAHHLASAWMLAVSALTALCADIAYILVGGELTTPVIVGWVASYILLGGALTHPSVTQLAAPAADPEPSITWGRFSLNALALAAVGVVLLGGIGPWGVAPVSAVAATLVVALVLWRLARLLVERERHLAQLRDRSRFDAALSAISRSAVTADTADAFVAELATHVHRATQGRCWLGPPHPPEGTDAWPVGDSWHRIVATGNQRARAEHDRRFVQAAVSIANAALQRFDVEQRLRHRSLHDTLTGLPNRALVIDQLGDAVKAASGTQPAAAVIFLDLDNFKDVNDHHGHAAGDHILAQLADRLAAAVRAQDTVGRLAGDEFVVVCPGANEAQAEALAQRLLTQIEEPYSLEGSATATVRASVGVSVAGPDSEPATLLQAADAAMYKAKAFGGGRSQLADHPRADPGSTRPLDSRRALS